MRRTRLSGARNRVIGGGSHPKGDRHRERRRLLVAYKKLYSTPVRQINREQHIYYYVVIIIPTVCIPSSIYGFKRLFFFQYFFPRLFLPSRID